MVRDVELLADGFRFLECPRWRDGRLYFVDMSDDKIFSLVPGGKAEVVAEVEHPAGIGFAANGDLLAIAAAARELRRMRNGKVEQTISLDGIGFDVLNDMVVDDKGGAYVGGLGAGLPEGRLTESPIAYVTPGGTVSVVADGLAAANGMAISRVKRTLIVAETFAYRMSAFDIASDGSLSNRRIWADFGGPPSTTMADALANDRMIPDGISQLDAEDAIWVADARGRGVLRLAEGGEELDRISFGAETVIAAMLGGASGDELFMMVGPPFDRIAALMAGSERLYKVYRAKVDVPAAS
jgi:sugar lactone lactonase YvrE